MIDVDGVLVTGRPSDGLHWATSLEADLGLSFAILQDTFFKRYWEDIVTGRADRFRRYFMWSLGVNLFLLVLLGLAGLSLALRR